MHSAGKAAYAVSTAGNAEPNPVENRELIAPDHVRQPYIGLGFKQNFVGGNGDSRFLTAAARHYFRMKESALQRFRIVAKDRCCQISLMHGGCVEGFGPHIVVGSLQFKLPIGEGSGGEADGYDHAVHVKQQRIRLRFSLFTRVNSPFVPQGADQLCFVPTGFRQKEIACGGIRCVRLFLFRFRYGFVLRDAVAV